MPIGCTGQTGFIPGRISELSLCLMMGTTLSQSTYTALKLIRGMWERHGIKLIPVIHAPYSYQKPFLILIYD